MSSRILGLPASLSITCEDLQSSWKSFNCTKKLWDSWNHKDFVEASRLATLEILPLFCIPLNAVYSSKY